MACPSTGQLDCKRNQGYWVSCLVIVGEATCNKWWCCVGVAQGRSSNGWGGLGLFCCCWWDHVLHSLGAGDAVHLCPNPGESKKSPGGTKSIFLKIFRAYVLFFSL